MPNVDRERIQRDLSGRLSSCHCNVASTLFFMRFTFFPRSGGDCPTFTLRQNRCVTSTNGTDSECVHKQARSLENTQILKKLPP